MSIPQMLIFDWSDQDDSNSVTNTGSMKGRKGIMRQLKDGM